MTAEEQEVIRIRDRLCGGVIESRALVGEGTEENVIYCVPSERAYYIALGDPSLSREEDIFCSKCLFLQKISLI